ncbi:MAG: diguanylate cyclase domain-containing protein [Bradymonadaceae bacterium]
MLGDLDMDRSFPALLDALPDGVLIADSSGTIVLVNDELTEMFGYDQDELIGEAVEKLVPPEHRDDHFDRSTSFFEDPTDRPMGTQLDLAGYRADETRLPIDIRLSPLPTSGETHVLAVVRDMRERRELERALVEKLEHEACHDDLTGLASRSLFREQLEKLAARAHRKWYTAEHRPDVRSDRRANFVAAFLDIDDFKAINDTYGHSVGDAVLECMAERLRDETRSTDTLGRFGGDEFTLLLDGIQTDRDLEKLIQRLKTLCQEPLDIEGRTFSPTLSIGIVWPSLAYFDREPDEELLDGLIRAADRAMFGAKDERQTGCTYELRHGLTDPPPVD